MRSDNRIDHLANLRTPGAAPVEVPQDAPLVTPALVEYLEKCGFGAVIIRTAGFPCSLDHAIESSHSQTFAGGQLSVIQFLRTLIRNGASS